MRELALATAVASFLALVGCSPATASSGGGDVLELDASGAELGLSRSSGNLDIITVTGNQVRVQGWAASVRSPSSSVWVHFYVNGPAGQGGTYVGAAFTSVSRPDVNTAFTITGNHGYDFKWTGHALMCAPGTRTLYVHIIDDAGNPVVGTKAYTVPPTSGVRTPKVHFDSSSSWPPILSNNPELTRLWIDQPAGRYIAPFFGKLIDGANPKMATTYVANAASYTGLSTSWVKSFTPAGASDSKPLSFIQLDSSTKTIGIWLNSKHLDGNYGLTTVTPGVRLATPARPWAEAGAGLSLSWYMRLPTVHTDDLTNVVPYVVNYVIVRHPDRGLHLWYGSSVYDARGGSVPPTFTGFDRGTQMGIFTEKLSDAAGGVSRGPNSFGFQWLPYSDEKYFDIVVTRDNLRGGLATYNAWAGPNGLPTWPTDDANLAAVEVIYVGFNPELWDGSSRNTVPDANGTLGSTYRSIRLRTVY